MYKQVLATLSQDNALITQHSQRAIINWQSFDIGVNESIRFVQPNTQSVILNRITSQSPSQILGGLSANGRVFTQP